MNRAMLGVSSLGLHIGKEVSVGDTAAVSFPRHLGRRLRRVIARQVCGLVGGTKGTPYRQLPSLSEVLEELQLVLLVLVDGRLDFSTMCVSKCGRPIVRLC